MACLSSFESFYAEFDLDSFQPIKYSLKEITLIYILLLSCKLLMQLLVYNLRKTKFKCIIICFMIAILFLFWWQCKIHQREFQISLFLCILFSTSLWKSDLILVTQNKLLFESNNLKLTAEGLSFWYRLCQTQVKLLALSSHTVFNSKQQRCKYTMVYLKDFFIVRLFLLLFIHNIARGLTQGLVAITAGVRVQNP